MRKSEFSLNLSALAVLSALLLLYSEIVGATDAGMRGPGIEALCKGYVFRGQGQLADLSFTTRIFKK
ncbi:MAG: hypothetical protein V4455_03410 [Pseudomonadota bacterium]